MNHYSKAIDSLKRITIDETMDIIYEIAKNNPAALNKACSKVVNREPTETVRAIGELIAACTTGRKIHAIKAIRQLTGMGLIEAKDVVNANWDRSID